MKITPDDPELLRSHAHLLASMGDEDAERAVRRLEALGVDTAADLLLSGLRARAGARTEAIEAILQALEETQVAQGTGCIMLNSWKPRARPNWRWKPMNGALRWTDKTVKLGPSKPPSFGQTRSRPRGVESGYTRRGVGSRWRGRLS